MSAPFPDAGTSGLRPRERECRAGVARLPVGTGSCDPWINHPEIEWGLGREPVHDTKGGNSR